MRCGQRETERGCGWGAEKEVGGGEGGRQSERERGRAAKECEFNRTENQMTQGG